ncbi:penicillin-binding protein 1A [Oikeobacillus pervagus]|uniref:Penicillin-binding protein 1A n=1 Tax=Oikeobacillus pervagus TaxID=1325931 RepID=A0AAJ1T629_9BACI|nr:transglycosylase domain-containing protein [Oikeobacillus pervagus]MDQ0216549.1 penicillin-binding protein 1A [Oikeobacillus pervagus]
MRTIFGYFLIILLLPLTIFIFYFANAESQKVQSFDKVLEEKINIKEVKLPQASKMVDQDGNTFLEYFQPNRIVLKEEDIPSFIKEVFLQSEDQHFYEHVGIDAAAVLRALMINSQADGIEQGASTITQQLARNLYLSFDKTYIRKISEVLYAYELEKKLSKDEILNLYLNAIYFQNGVYGVEAASQFYFQKNVKELSKAQMAFIAAIPNNPTLYDPIRHFENTKKRQEHLIDLMAKREFLTHQEAVDAKNEQIKLNIRQRVDNFANYSVYAEDEMKRLIATKEGFTEKLQKTTDTNQKAQISKELSERVEEVLSSGVIIHTNLNPALQRKAENAVSNVLAWSGSVEGSATVVDNQSREISAIVGGKDFHKTDFHRAFQSFRHPGSSIKPLLDYGPYIDKYQPSIYSTVNANGYCLGNWCPKNYSGKEYGMVTLKTALANSYNTPAVRLLMKTGIQDAFAYLDKFEFERVGEKEKVPAASLGAIPVNTLEMAGAYTSFIDGTYVPPRAIEKVTDLNGEVLYEWDEKPIRVWSSLTTSKMRELLAAVVQSGTGRKANLAAAYVGGKTGTSNNAKDLWFAGLTDRYTAAVWVGKDKGSGITYLERSQPNIMIWRRIMQ